MRIGIHGRYFACEATYAAARLAQWAQSQRHEVTLLSTTDRHMTLSAVWDELVVPKFSQRFTDWMAGCDAVVWTHTPAEQQIKWAKKHGAMTIGLALWHELRPKDADVYRLFDRVLCPSRVCAQLLAKAWRLKNVVAVPWDSGFPLTSKTRSSHATGLRVFVPMLDRSPCHMEMTAITSLERLLQQFSELTITIAYMTSQLTSRVVRSISQLVARYKPRVRLVRGPSVAMRPMLFHNHDVTLWLSHAEDIGVVGLQSLSVGTPLIGFQISPITEFLQDGYNGRIVLCDCGLSELGAPIADPQYIEVERAVASLCAHPKLLTNMEQRALQGMHERRVQFGVTLCRLFG